MPAEPAKLSLNQLVSRSPQTRSLNYIFYYSRPPESCNRLVLELTGSPPLARSYSGDVSILKRRVQSYPGLFSLESYNIYPSNKMEKRVSVPFWLPDISLALPNGAAKRLVRGGKYGSWTTTVVRSTAKTGPAEGRIICMEEAKKLDKTSSLVLVSTDKVDVQNMNSRQWGVSTRNVSNGRMKENAICIPDKTYAIRSYDEPSTPLYL